MPGDAAKGETVAIQWNAALALGVRSIDGQHQELFRQANALLEAMMKGRSQDELHRLLAFLGRYAADHFAEEERLMARHRYPPLAAHRQQHAEFVTAFSELQGGIERKGATAEMAIRLNRFVCEWLRDHIGSTDRELARFLKERGIQESAA